MPVVDLSMVGLEGQQAYYNRMATAANTRAVEAQTRGQELENEAADQMNTLNQEAGRVFQDIAMGKKRQPNLDVSGTVEGMTSVVDPYEEVANIYARGGMPGKALEMLGKTSEIRKREQDILDGEVTREQKRLENIVKGADVVSRFVGVARNRSEMKFGLQKLRESGTVEPEFVEQLEGIIDNTSDEGLPNIAAYLNEQAMTAADRARISMQESANARTEEYRARTLSRLDRATDISAAAQRDTERHRRALEKAAGNGAGSAAAPNPQELVSAEAALRNQVFKGAPKASQAVSAAAQYVSSQAKAIVKANKAIDWETAVQQAIIKGQANGMFQNEEAVPGISLPILGTFGAKPAKQKFERFTGKTPDTAKPPPVGKDGKVDPTKLEAGTYYILSDGRRGKFNGKSIVIDE